ncbi:hypothetical protein NPIL_125951 [Nephila pilipes]|uniref:Uncharacterized protein n=1 Tax=Nephila pilipes TaxID=299642 RepID=A0A8X6R5S4_NEPPI|nr:hypothetical protein NPIL_125951 [Nephila pilipes]
MSSLLELVHQSNKINILKGTLLQSRLMNELSSKKKKKKIAICVYYLQGKQVVNTYRGPFTPEKNEQPVDQTISVARIFFRSFLPLPLVRKGVVWDA